jgi:hypothetical protein
VHNHTIWRPAVKSLRAFCTLNRSILPTFSPRNNSA